MGNPLLPPPFLAGSPVCPEVFLLRTQPLFPMWVPHPRMWSLSLPILSTSAPWWLLFLYSQDRLPRRTIPELQVKLAVWPMPSWVLMPLVMSFPMIPIMLEPRLPSVPSVTPLVREPLEVPWRALTVHSPFNPMAIMYIPWLTTTPRWMHYKETIHFPRALPIPLPMALSLILAYCWLPSKVGTMPLCSPVFPADLQS